MASLSLRVFDYYFIASGSLYVRYLKKRIKYTRQLMSKTCIITTCSVFHYHKVEGLLEC
jgi:hypothetical protein